MISCLLSFYEKKKQDDDPHFANKASNDLSSQSLPNSFKPQIFLRPPGITRAKNLKIENDIVINDKIQLCLGKVLSDIKPYEIESINLIQRETKIILEPTFLTCSMKVLCESD